MAAYGAYVCYLMLRRPEELAVEENHVSWAHMYRMMFVPRWVRAAYCCRGQGLRLPVEPPPRNAQYPSARHTERTKAVLAVLTTKARRSPAEAG
jgi:hypothetical protein